MCTVTIITLNNRLAEVDAGPEQGRRIRLACNRDELLTRPLAFPPVIRRFGERQAILPVDPVSGGTWIAVNDAKIAAVLLNVNAWPRPLSGPPPRHSRGQIIPSLLHHDSLRDALAEVQRLDPAVFPAFRLVLLDTETAVEVRSNGGDFDIRPATTGARPLFYTSSGLGDAVVEAPRRELFETIFPGEGDLAEAQARFHRHSWAQRRDISVCMSRRDARTVNHTIVEIMDESVKLIYLPCAPDLEGIPTRLALKAAKTAACPS